MVYVVRLSTRLLMILLAVYAQVSSSDHDLQVEITSSVILMDNIVCENASFSLTCNAYNATKPEYKWSPSEKTNRTIIVTATNMSTHYTCTVMDGSYNMGYATVSILSNGSTPVLAPANFNEDEKKLTGTFHNFTVAVLKSNPFLIGGDWSRLHAPLNDSGRVFISNFTSNGRTYSSLAIHNLYFSDSGAYSYCTSNECGKSCLSVDLHVVPDTECYDHTKPLPITSITGHQIAIEGEDILYTCSFKSNFDGYIQRTYNIFWSLKLQNGDSVVVNDTSNSSEYKMDKPIQECPSYNYSCCNFISIIHINAIDTLNGAVITCHASAGQLNSEKSSSLTVIPKPLITTPPKNLSVENNFIAEFKCFARASSQYYELTKFRWLNDGSEVKQSDSKYSVVYHPVGNGEDDEWESILDVADVTKQDDGMYTCIVYYDSIVLAQHHIMSGNLDLSDEASAHLEVSGDSYGSSDSLDSPSVIIIAVVMFALLFGTMAVIICFVKMGCCRLDGLSLLNTRSRYHNYNAIGTTTPPSNEQTHYRDTGTVNPPRPNEQNPHNAIGAISPHEQQSHYDDYKANMNIGRPRPNEQIGHCGPDANMNIGRPRPNEQNGRRGPDANMNIGRPRPNEQNGRHGPDGAPRALSIGERAKQRPPLQITDFRLVYNVLRQGAISSWKPLGMQLGLTSDKLNEISADCRDNDYERHIERVFELWKQQSQKRTWKDLIRAIEVTTVNPQLCMDLSVKHLADFDDKVLDKDLSNEVLIPMAKYWFELGLALGIDETQLDNIPVADSSQGFRKMLHTWWQQNFAADRTWNTIVFSLDAVNLSVFAKEVYDSRIGAE